MSGGHFDYNQYKIGDIVEEIQQLIDTNHSKELDDWGSQIGREYSPVVIAEFENAVNYLKLAQIYTHRIDWLVSGDDGEEHFLKRLEDDLAENRRQQRKAKRG